MNIDEHWASESMDFPSPISVEARSHGAAAPGELGAHRQPHRGHGRRRSRMLNWINHD